MYLSINIHSVDLVRFLILCFRSSRKKIGDIPEERRKRLLHLLEPRLISRAWEIAGTRYEDPKLASKNASSFLSDGDGDIMLEVWNCRTSGGINSMLTL